MNHNDLNNDSDPKQISRLAINFPIPAKPELLHSISGEVEKPSCDFARVAELISRDVAISGAVLKLVNSAYFGLANRVESIQQAINFIGLNMTINLVRGFLLNRVYEKNGIIFPRFWESAEITSLVSKVLAEMLLGINPDKSYLTGLFHDTGIPLISNQYSDYKDCLSLAEQSENGLFTDIEDELYNINHAIVGGLISQEWGLPEDVSEVITNHHNIDYLLANLTEQQNEKTRLFITLKLAGLALDLYRANQPSFEWIRFKGPVLNQLNIEEQEVIMILCDILENLEFTRSNQ